MRRVLAVLALVILIIGGFSLWWYLRDTPAKVLHDGFTQLTQMRSAKQLTLDVDMTDPSTHATTGFTSVGQLDAADLTHPQSSGTLRIGSKTSTEEDQTVDVVLTTLEAALRPQNISAQYRAMYQVLVGSTSTMPYLTVNRNAFLTANGYGEAIATGKPTDIRSALAYLLPILVPGNKLTYSSDKSRVSATFRFDKTTVQPFLIVLVHAWTGKNPTVDEYAWIDRVAQDLSQGTYTLTIDRATRVPLSLVADFSVADDAGIVLSTVHASIAIDGLNAPVSIGTPTDTKDVTDIIAKPKAVPSLPTSAFASSTTVPTTDFNATTTGFTAPSAGSYIGSVGNVVPTDTDLIHAGQAPSGSQP
ncbi:MAG: hypothetical protein WA001_04125 [Patescibacteria group bacterium]